MNLKKCKPPPNFLVRSPGRLEELFENLKIALFFKTPNGKISGYKSPAARRLPAKIASFALHVIAIFIILSAPNWFPEKKTAGDRETSVTQVATDYKIIYPVNLNKPSGGGGGGAREKTPASRGKIPPFGWKQIAPPSAKPTEKAEIQAPPTVVGPPDIKLPDFPDLPFGDPKGPPAPPSSGPGGGSGIGTGDGTGVGEGKGPGVGPGEGGGTGGGVYQPGHGGVSFPVCLYCPIPRYTEEARKAKLSGIVSLLILVEADGKVSEDVKVAKGLGMGLDEEATRTVKTWRFKPSEKNGVPVRVRFSVEIKFTLY